MRKISKLSAALLVLTLMFGGALSCNKGQNIPGADKSTIQSVSAGVSAVDSAELIKNVQIKIDAVNSGITSEAQGKTLEKELNELRGQAKSPELIKKIDEIIHQIAVQLVILKTNDDLKNSLAQLNKTVKDLLDKIAAFTPNVTSKEQVQSTIETINKFLADIQYQKEMIAQLKKLILNKADFASADKELDQLLAALAEKEKGLQASLTQAIAKQKDFLSAAELEAKIDQKKDALLEKIAIILAKASEKYDVNKITTAESLINSIKVTSDIAQLEIIKTKLSELEVYLKQAFENLKTKRAELIAVIMEAENLYKEAQAANYSKLKVIENYLASLKQANLDPDIAKLESLIAAISKAYIAIADKERAIKEAQIKEALAQELNAIKAQYDAQLTAAQKVLDAVNSALKEKEFIEEEIASGNFSVDLIAKLNNIQSVLAQTDLQTLALAISEVQQKTASLQERSGTYLPELSGFAATINTLDANFDKAQELAVAALDEIAEMKTTITEAMNDIAGEETPAKDEIVVTEGENQITSELNLRNLLKYAKVKNGEIIFYKRVVEVTDKEIVYKKKLKGKDGKIESYNKGKTVKVKKFKKIAYKKWKLEFVAGANNKEKKLTIEIYESLFVNRAWTEYKKFAFFVLKDLWYDRFNDIADKNAHKWIKILKK